MAEASHRRAGAYLAAHSRLPAAELLRLAEIAARKVTGRPGTIIRTGLDGSSVSFAVTNALSWPVMRFRVLAADARSWGADLTTEITSFSTLQPHLLGRVPVGPKRLVGWREYSRYMKQLAAEIEITDPSALVSIVSAA